MLPPNKPKLDAASVRQIIDKKLGLATARNTVVVLAIRGYYENSMGAKGANDRGIYDDALFIQDLKGNVTNWNGNTDPSIFRKRIATLVPGVWKFETGLHGISRPNPYPAFRQGERFTVYRDEVGQDAGFFGINLHRGGYGTTSSEGCQTVPPAQWDAFRDTLYAALGTNTAQVKAGAKKVFKYALLTIKEAEQLLGRDL
jgi:lysozyme